jgi:D-galactarolactone cycloisomerase
MKVIAIRTFILRVPLGDNRFFSSQCSFPERNSLLVRIETDDGLVGWGEGGQYGPPEPVQACIESVLAPFILGRSPHEAGRLWEELYVLTRDYGRKGCYIEALSAIDIALWDLRGKAFGVPIHTLLGGAFRTSITGYATGCYYRGNDFLDHDAAMGHLVTEAASFAESGFGLLKIKIGLLSIEADEERVAAIRKAVGPKMGILADSNHAYNAATAIRMGRVLEKYGCLFFEEPVTPEDRNGYRRVRQSLDIAIAGGEAEFTRWGFLDLIAGECVDIVQPDLCVCGGFSEFQKISALASSHSVAVIPHVWGSGIALAAALHGIASLPPMPHTANPVPLQNEPVIEFDRNHNPLRDELLVTRLQIGKDGRVPVPQGPGLGVEVDEEVLGIYTSLDKPPPGAVIADHRRGVNGGGKRIEVKL